MHTPTFLKRLKKKKELPSHLKKKSLSFFDFF